MASGGTQASGRLRDDGSIEDAAMKQACDVATDLFRPVGGRPVLSGANGGRPRRRAAAAPGHASKSSRI